MQTVLQQWTEAPPQELSDEEEVDDQEDARFRRGPRFLHDDVADLSGDEDEDHISGDEDDEDEPFKYSTAAPGEEGIGLWDLLGEGFLQVVSNLGTDYSFAFYSPTTQRSFRG